MIKFIFLFLVFCYFGLVYMQILVLDFQCVVNDMLFWELVINNCGFFVFYDIYFSVDEVGLYILFNSIMDFVEIFFFYSDVNN